MARLSKTLQAQLDARIAQGFDRSTAVNRHIRIHCSQCAACVINGVPCHETGCPNETRPCRECGAPIPKRLRYLECEDCSNINNDLGADEADDNDLGPCPDQCGATGCIYCDPAFAEGE